uniref:NSF attachment protein alpha n=1 Tax=Rousettus aegyptiacus TaxID=9407 RepID=A0A7J8CJJ0_ROUAE|nr:NSF attachment protein alpha [Rousettus aegyptiacus]
MDNSGKEAEAMALLAEAERKVKNSQSFFSGLFGGSSKIEEACEIYARAANMFKMAKNWSAAGNAFCQAAQLHLQLEQYQKAIDIYEQVGTNAMDSPLLKYSAKDYFFKAALCHFCIDMLNAKLAVQKYEDLFPAFSDSREYKLMKKLLEAHEEQNVDSYTEAVKEYDSISRLDQWLTTMLLRIKKTIQGDEEDLR